MVKTLLEFTKQLFPLRTCNYALTEENIQKEKFKVCLEYHIGNCKAPCVKLQSETDYDIGIQHIKEVLKGKYPISYKTPSAAHEFYAQEMAYEQAQLMKEKIDLLQNYQAKSTIVNPNINDVDVFSIVSDKEYAYVNFFKVASGAIIQSHSLELKKKLEETDEELLLQPLLNCASDFRAPQKSVIPPSLWCGKG